MSAKIPPRILTATVGKIVDFGNETRHYELYYDPGQTLEFIAGQFVSVLYPHDGKIIRRAYSICSPPKHADHLDLVLKLVETGKVTPWFWTFKGGERIQIHGPLGKFILPETIDFDIVFVATGTGIAPFRSMIHTLLPAGFPRKIWLLFGVRYDTMIPYLAEWADFEKQYPNFKCIVTISRPSLQWKGETGYVQTKIEKLFPDPAGKRVYICGLNEMIQAVQEACLKTGYTKDHISFERYD